MTTGPAAVPARSRFATSDEDAKNRYEVFKAFDPFPAIHPSLLNSADIADYISATGMIFPFVEGHLTKPASYGVPLRGRCVYWDAKGNRTDFILSDDRLPEYRDAKYRKELILEKNSIAFVTLLPTIRLPEYIAVRFNLTIQDVYRGLLLGSGPIVDPGFQGKLSFPLHNLTSSEYRYRAGDEIVWMEFNKISGSNRWSLPAGISVPPRSGEYKTFPGQKLLRKDVADYLRHANGDLSIRSSIPIEIQETSKSISWIKRATYGTVVGVTLALAAAILAGYQLVAQVQSSIISVAEDLKLQKTPNSADKIDALSAEIDRLKSQIETLKRSANAQENTVSMPVLEKMLDLLRSQAIQEKPLLPLQQ